MKKPHEIGTGGAPAALPVSKLKRHHKIAAGLAVALQLAADIDQISPFLHLVRF